MSSERLAAVTAGERSGRAGGNLGPCHRCRGVLVEPLAEIAAGDVSSRAGPPVRWMR